MVLNGVWLRKKMVQSSRCRSAPSGSIRLARSLLMEHQSTAFDGVAEGLTPHPSRAAGETGR